MAMVPGCPPRAVGFSHPHSVHKKCLSSPLLHHWLFLVRHRPLKERKERDESVAAGGKEDNMETEKGEKRKGGGRETGIEGKREEKRKRGDNGKGRETMGQAVRSACKNLHRIFL